MNSWTALWLEGKHCSLTQLLICYLLSVQLLLSAAMKSATCPQKSAVLLWWLQYSCGHSPTVNKVQQHLNVVFGYLGRFLSFFFFFFCPYESQHNILSEWERQQNWPELSPAPQLLHGLSEICNIQDSNAAIWVALSESTALVYDEQVDGWTSWYWTSWWQQLWHSDRVKFSEGTHWFPHAASGAAAGICTITCWAVRHKLVI